MNVNSLQPVKPGAVPWTVKKWGESMTQQTQLRSRKDVFVSANKKVIILVNVQTVYHMFTNTWTKKSL